MSGQKKLIENEYPYTTDAILDIEEKTFEGRITFLQTNKQNSQAMSMTLQEFDSIVTQLGYIKEVCKYPGCQAYHSEAKNYCCNACSSDHEDMKGLD